MQPSTRVKTIAVLPAYQAAQTLVSFFNSLPKELFDDIIISDDCSRDRTYEIAMSLPGVHATRTTKNLGYGGNMKVCLLQALERGGDIIVEIHPDGEYLPDGIRAAIQAVAHGAKLVLGNRFTRGKPRGMYGWKYVPSRLLTWLDNLVLGTDIPDLHQGFRVYTKDFLTKINWEANDMDYAFTWQIILQAVFHRLPIRSVPVTAIYRGKKRGATLRHTCWYTVKTAWLLVLYFLARRGVRVRFLTG